MRLLLLLGLVVSTSWLLLVPATARAVSFSYQVDEMTVAGGGYDEVYDFSGNSLPEPADWSFTTVFGTATVANGLLTLSDPGTNVPISVDGTSMTMTRSDVALSWDYMSPLDYVSTSTWVPKAPVLNEWYGYAALAGDPDPLGMEEMVGVFVANFDATRASVSNALPGLQVFHLYGTYDKVAADWHFDIQATPIDASDLTGPVVFEISQHLLDPSLPQFSLGARLSIDGGATYLSYEDILLQDGKQSSSLTLAADPITAVPEPRPGILLLPALAVVAGLRRLPWTRSFAGSAPVSRAAS